MELSVSGSFDIDTNIIDQERNAGSILGTTFMNTIMQLLTR